MTRLAVVGASGRMGRAVVRLAFEAGMELVCAVATTEVGRDAGELAGMGPIGTVVADGFAAVEHARADVVIDFSTPHATLALAPIAAAAGSAIVSGTTGLGDDARAALDRAAARVPVLWEPNMSLGVHAVLSSLVARAAMEGFLDWDVEIVEAHHRAKVDAPSGTALRLAEAGAGRARRHAARARQARSSGSPVHRRDRDARPPRGRRRGRSRGPLVRRWRTNRAHSPGDEPGRVRARSAARGRVDRRVGKTPGTYSLADVLSR